MYAKPFTALMAEGEVSILRRLHGMLEHITIQEREQFSDLMNAAFKWCSLDHTSLAGDLGYSPSSVYRWVEGDSAPHKSLWPSVTKWIMNAIEAKIENILQQHRAVVN